jgi:thiamine-phosphate pyrophosphorylase
MVITEAAAVGAAATLEAAELAAARARPGSMAVQLRDLGLSARARLKLGRALRDVTRRHGQLLLVNDRLDLAHLLEADGVHLGEQSVPSEDARRLLGAKLVTRACHDPELVARGEYAADALVLSPIVEPRKGRAPLGVSGVERARALLGGAGLPRGLIALGGVDARSAGACLAAGADGVAVLGAARSALGLAELLKALGIER